MELNLSDEQTMLRDSVQRFVAEQYGLDGLRRVEAEATGWASDNWRQLAELGWLALPFAEEAGGLGGSLEDLAVLMIEFGSGHVLEPYVSTAVMCGQLLADAGGQGDLVGQVIAGEKVLAFAHTETARPADPLAVTATVATAEGDGYVLSGAKRVVVDAAGADHLVVSALVGETAGLFLVDTASAGLSMTTYGLIDGSAAADIVFDRLKLPADRLIATGELARTLTRDAIERGTLAWLAQAVGSLERCVSLTSAYVAERQQYGRPIGKFQALQHILANMFVESQEARSALYHALAHWHATPEERSRALSSAKIVICSAGRYISRNGIQLHGGYGMTEEFLIGHHFRRQIVIEKLFGDLDHHLAAFAAGAV